MQIKKIKLFIKENAKSQLIGNDLKKILIANNYIISDTEFDLAISVGGDGTFLKMIYDSGFNQSILYFGINTGNLGFLNEIEYDNIIKFISHLNNQEYKIEELSFLKIKITTKDKEFEYNSLNEIVMRSADYNVLHLPIYVGDELLEKYHGDGLIISTPIGSTAYNLSFDGPIIDHDLEALTITSIAPVHNKIFNSLNNSIVLSKEKRITLIPENDNNIAFIIDGRVMNKDNIIKIELVLSSSKLKVLHMPQYSNIKQINNKLL